MRLPTCKSPLAKGGPSIKLYNSELPLEDSDSYSFSEMEFLNSWSFRTDLMVRLVCGRLIVASQDEDEEDEKGELK